MTPDSRPKESHALMSERYFAGLSVLCLIAALLIGVARVQGKAFRWLALMLLGLNFLFATIDSSVGSTLFFNTVNNSGLVLAPLFMVCFWRTFAAEQGIHLSRLWGHWFWALVALGGAFAASIGYKNLILYLVSQAAEDATAGELSRLLPPSDAIDGLWNTWGMLGLGTCIWLPLLILRKSRGAASNSAYWVSLSLLTMFLGPLGSFLIKLATAAVGVSETSAELMAKAWFFGTIALQPLSICAFLMLSLRRRIMSFEFALNLTAVYLVTGSVLVAAFWLLKKNIESMGYIEAGSQDALLSAALAALAFVAKQLKGVAEQTLKRLIFRNFNRRVAQLEQFKSQMGHHKTREALDKGSLTALTDFCQGARLDLWVSDGRDYVSQMSGARLQVDDPIPLLLRARRASLGPDSWPAPPAMPIRLAVPAFHRLDLVFFLLIYDATDLPVLRPDEIRQIEEFVQRWETERALLELDGWRDGSLRQAGPSVG
jgi:hypothetical protein